MIENILPELPMLITFITASFVLAVIPGPVVLYVVTRTMMQGRASGLASVAGVTLGNIGNAHSPCFLYLVLRIFRGLVLFLREKLPSFEHVRTGT